MVKTLDLRSEIDLLFLCILTTSNFSFLCFEIGRYFYKGLNVLSATFPNAFPLCTRLTCLVYLMQSPKKHPPLHTLD